MLRLGSTKGAIDEYLKCGLNDDRCTSFQTADALWSLFQPVERALGPPSWSAFPCGSRTLYSRNILHCVPLLLSHFPLADHMVFGPERLFDSTGRREDNEIHTVYWWWNTQELMPRGETVVPLLFAYDQTHLINLAREKTAWPVYPSICNLTKDFGRQCSKCACVLVAILPISQNNPKDGKMHRSWCDAIEHILKPIAERDIAGLGYEWDCADGKIGRCYLILVAWIADHQEHVILARIINRLCPICEIPQTKIGHKLSIRVVGVKDRDPKSYQQALERGNSADAEYLGSIGLQVEKNSFWRFPLCNVYRLWQPEGFHLLHLGILTTIMDWLVRYLQQPKVLGRFNDPLKLIQPYPGL